MNEALDNFKSSFTENKYFATAIFNDFSWLAFNPQVDKKRTPTNSKK
jgi:hypothetical protein